MSEFDDVMAGGGSADAVLAARLARPLRQVPAPRPCGGGPVRR